MRVPPTESAPWDGQQIVADRLGDEIGPRSPGSFGKQIKRACRFHQLEAVFQSLIKSIALALIIGNEAGVVEIPGNNPGLLHHAGSADKGELLELGHFLDDLPRAVGVSEPPSRHAVCFAETVED